MMHPVGSAAVDLPPAASQKPSDDSYASTAPILEIDGLTIGFPGGRDLVRDVSFRMYPGVTLGIVGESGSGKSLTCRAMLGLLPDGMIVKGGAIWFDGKDLTTLDRRALRSVRRDHIGAIFQDPGSYLNPASRIGHQIVESVYVHKQCSRREAKEKALALLEAVGMKSPRDVFGQFPFELSGGMLQRVMIAIALSGDPSLLIADEVTTALDMIVQAQIVRLLQTHKTERNLSMVMVSHDLALVAQTCDHLLVMKDGAVVELGKRADVLRNPTAAYTRTLIANHLKFGLEA